MKRTTHTNEQIHDGRWLTINEAIAERGRLTGRPGGRTWFQKPLVRYDGRSRLEVWEDHGLAVRTDHGTGIWLINPQALSGEARA